jgi:CcmD family protein
MIKLFSYNKQFLYLFFLLISNNLLAQSNTGVEMADQLRQSGKIYVVVAVVLIIFIGIVLFLFALDKRIKKLESESK